MRITAPPSAARSITFLFLTLLLITGCADKNKIPSGIIPPDKMGKIIWDMMEADEYSNLYLAKDTLLVKDSLRSKPPTWAKDSLRIKDSTRLGLKLSTLKLYQQIFQLHEVTREDFQKSYRYYSGRPDLSRRLFDSVQVLGNRERNTSLTSDNSKKASPITPDPVLKHFANPQSFMNRPGGKIPLLPPNHLLPDHPTPNHLPPNHLPPGHLPPGIPATNHPGAPATLHPDAPATLHPHTPHLKAADSSKPKRSDTTSHKPVAH